MSEFTALLQVIIWPALFLIVLWSSRLQLAKIVSAVETRIAQGDALEVSAGPGSVKLGASEKLKRPEAEIKHAEAAVDAAAALPKPSPNDARPDEDLLRTVYLVHNVGSTWVGSDGVERRRVTLYVDADSDEILERVRRVTYHLHPSFQEPIRDVREKAGGFALRTAVWGEFNVAADVYFTGTEHPLRLYRYLNL